jgi:TonB family protein
VRRNPLPILSLASVLLLSGGWLAYALTTRSRERALGIRMEAQDENLSRILSELEQLKNRQAEERKRSDDLLRQVAQAPTPAERKLAEERLVASQVRERELTKQVEEASQRLPSQALADVKPRPSTGAAQPKGTPGELSSKLPDPRVESATADQGIRNLPASDDSAYLPPKILNLAPGRYPVMALSNPMNPYLRQQVSILLHVQLDADGKPEKTTVTRGVPGSLGYNEAALEVIRRSTFEPAQRNGKPVAGSMDIQVKFTKVVK